MNRRQIGSVALLSVVGLGTNSASAQTPTDQEQTNIETVHRFIEMIETQDISLVDAVISPDYVSSDPTAAPGIDAYKSRLQSSFDQQGATWTELATPEEDLIAQGDSVVRLGRYQGTTTGGKLVDLPDVRWFELSDGLIVTWYGGPDSGQITEAIYG